MARDERAAEDGSPEEHHVRDPARTPWLGLLLGYGAMVPLVAAAAAVWFVDGGPARFVLHAAIVWSACLLAFFAGVRRGVSFRTEGGPTVAQLAMMFWLFVLAVAALSVPGARLSLGLLFAGFASLAVVDPRSARTGEAPLYFERLRPPQMVPALAAVAALLLRTLQPGWPGG